MLGTTDRLSALEKKAHDFTGIDFVQVVTPCEQLVLRVFFLTDVRGLNQPFSEFDPPVTHPDPTIPLTHASIVIHAADGDPNVPNVPLDTTALLTWGVDEQTQRTFLEFKVEHPGDFFPYRLRIDDPRVTGSVLSRIDPFFNDVEFSFKIGCDTDLDCEQPPAECPPDPFVDFPVDYQARDFVSLRNALLDFAAQRYPKWTLPIEADVGSMVMELMAALGDEFSYIQDHYGREAYLETATERRSLRKKARLLDFEIHDGRSASTFLEFIVSVDVDAAIEPPDPHDPHADPHKPRPRRVLALSDNGSSVTFEVGTGLADQHPGEVPGHFDPNPHPLKVVWNAGALVPYVFDEDQVCLPPGATEMFIGGRLDVADISDKGVIVRPLLLRTEPSDAAKPRRRHLVHLVEVATFVDPLTSEEVTRLVWGRDDALPFGIDQRDLFVSLNVVPATGGETVADQAFMVGEGTGPNADLPRVVTRDGPLPPDGGDRPDIFLYSLAGTEDFGLGFVGEDLRATNPEIRLRDEDGTTWDFARSLLTESEERPVFTLEDGIWRRIVSYRVEGQEFVHSDYASGAGYTIRFGDGLFGKQPASPTRFEVTYRLGTGTRANVPEGTITHLVIEDHAIVSVSNPFDVTSGVDPESAGDIRKLVPEGYRQDVRFAVRPEDYGMQAEKLDFVQRAFGRFRWTGSWLSAWVAADPVGSFTLSESQRTSLDNWLNCVRQAGREVIVKSPRTIGVDLQIEICVESFAYAGQVKQRVLEALFGRGGIRPVKGFFHPDNFTFGTPLRRSALEAVIQEVPGVRAVLDILLRERGIIGFRQFTELVHEVDADAVIRVENDPAHPDHGRVELVMEGGA